LLFLLGKLCPAPGGVVVSTAAGGVAMGGGIDKMCSKNC
jgi:hypothetical protein